MNIDELQEIENTQICIQLIYEAYAIQCKRRGVIPCELFITLQFGNQIMRQWNEQFIGAINKYMIIHGFNEGLASLQVCQEIHHKIVHQ